jgi:hypothetical protein
MFDATGHISRCVPAPTHRTTISSKSHATTQIGENSTWRRTRLTIARQPWNLPKLSLENTEVRSMIALETEVSLEHDECHLHMSESGQQESRVGGLRAFQRAKLIAENNGFDPEAKPISACGRTE